MSDKRKSNLMGVKPTLDINPLTRDFKQPESVLKKTAKSGPSMAEIGAVVGLGTAAGYTSVKKSKDVTEKESKKSTKRPGKPARGKKKGMDQEERRKYFGVKKSSLGVESRSLGGEMKRGYGAARQKGMGLEDEGLGLEMSKGSDYIKDLL